MVLTSLFISVATPTGIKSWIAAVAGAAGLVVGLVVGLLGAGVIVSCQRRRRRRLTRPDTLHRKSSSMSVTAPVLGLNQPIEHYTDTPPDQISTHQR